jgi:hypothetical protein
MVGNLRGHAAGCLRCNSEIISGMTAFFMRRDIARPIMRLKAIGIPHAESKKAKKLASSSGGKQPNNRDGNKLISTPTQNER